MGEKSDNQAWGLVQSPEYLREYARLSSKYRSQIARKTHDLMHHPRPGGSRTTLKGYHRLCRVKAGDFRIIYTYDETVVQLLSLRRRDEATYDSLDELEIRQLEGFQQIGGKSARPPNIPDWEELARTWAAPKAKPIEVLPQPITSSMLEGLGVPPEFRTALLQVTTVDALLDCDEVSLEVRQDVLDKVCASSTKDFPTEPVPVVVMSELVDDVAAGATGPIDAMNAGKERRSQVESSALTLQLNPLPGLPAPLVVISARRQSPMTPYRGNTSKGVAKDTKYTVKLDGTIQLLYSVGDNERALLTTDEHPELVALVNEAKHCGGGQQGGGGFLLNEYRHVLVPCASKEVLYAGVYTRDLEFSFEGLLITPVAPPSIRPGEPWPGPHVGIRYTLAAGAMDVRYEAETARGTTRRVCLTDYHSAHALEELLLMLRNAKPNGGAVYVNEARELFAPVEVGSVYQRVYIGHLGDKPWFPDPS